MGSKAEDGIKKNIRDSLDLSTRDLIWGKGRWTAGMGQLYYATAMIYELSVCLSTMHFSEWSFLLEDL